MKKNSTRRIIAILFTLCMLAAAFVPSQAEARSTVRNGSRGEDVRTLQVMLNTVAGAGLQTDGICGPKTVSAVKNYQAGKGLTADGICGPKTWAALEADYNAANNSNTAGASSVQKGTYVLVPGVSSRMALDVSGNGTASGTNVQIYEQNGTSAQSFSIIQVNGDWYKIEGAASGKVLDVAWGSRESGTNVQIYDWNGTDAQLFKFVPAGNNQYYIQNKLGCFLDVSGAGTENGTNVQVYTGNNTAAQKWTLVLKTVVMTPAPSVNYRELSQATHETQGKRECVVTAISMLIRRELYLEGKDYSRITKSVVRNSYNGGGTIAYWSTITAKANKNAGAAKTLTTVSTSGKSADENCRKVISLLESRPEGIVAYFYSGSKSCHAVLISNYDKSTGTFYVSDPASSNYKYVSLTDCFLMNSRYSWQKSVPGIFAKLNRVVYFK